MSPTAYPKPAPGYRQLIPVWSGWVGRFRRDPIQFLMEARAKHGDVVRLQLGPIVFHLLAHPDHIKHVLLDQQKNYPRGKLYRIAALGAGDGLVTTDGAVWRRFRRMAQPAFHYQRIMALTDLITECTHTMLQKWAGYEREEKPLDIASEFMALTLRIAGRSFLSVDLANEAERFTPAVTEALKYLEHRLNHPLSLPLSVPTPRNLRFRRAMDTIDKVILGAITERRRQPDLDRGDLLSVLLSVRDGETGLGLTDHELRDQFRTFLVAGYETTAVGLAWTAHMIERHPAIARRLQKEVADVSQGRTPSAADVPRLVFTRQVIEESLRLYPPVYALSRTAAVDDRIGGFPIRAGTMILLSPYVTQRHPEVWSDPETFDPDRFSPDSASRHSRFSWFPFIGGPHQCIGQEFAMVEMILVIAMMVQRFRLEQVPGTQVTAKPMLSLRPENGLPMSLKAASERGD